MWQVGRPVLVAGSRQRLRHLHGHKSGTACAVALCRGLRCYRLPRWLRLSASEAEGDVNLGIQSEIEARVRRAIPDGAGVLQGSLPVVSFGDPGTAAVATVSLNPSSREFLTRAGEWLPDSQRRLASLHSCGVQDPGELDAGQVRQVVAESYG